MKGIKKETKSYFECSHFPTEILEESKTNNQVEDHDDHFGDDSGHPRIFFFNNVQASDGRSNPTNAELVYLQKQAVSCV